MGRRKQAGLSPRVLGLLRVKQGLALLTEGLGLLTTDESPNVATMSRVLVLFLDPLHLAYKALCGEHHEEHTDG